MCTLPLKTCRAIAPPISAAAMLSRKRREHEDDGKQRKAALPAVRQERRHLVRDAAVLEMPRQQRKAHQQQKQVRQNHRLVLHVQAEAGEPGAGLETGEDQLVEHDRGKARQRDLQRLVMEESDADQRQREQDEVDGDAEHIDRLCRRRLRSRGRRGQTQCAATAKTSCARKQCSAATGLRPDDRV